MFIELNDFLYLSSQGVGDFQDIHEVTQPRQWAKKSSAGIGGS